MKLLIDGESMLKSKRIMLRSLATFALVAGVFPVAVAPAHSTVINGLNYSIQGNSAKFIGCQNFACPTNLVIPAKVPGTNAAVTTLASFSIVGQTFQSLSLPSSLKVIETNSATGITVSSELVLPAGLTTIERTAFSGSTLSSIVFGENITFIGDAAFASASVAFPTSIRMKSGSIGEAAFVGVKFSQVILGAEFSSIGTAAFAGGVNSTIANLNIGGGNIGTAAFDDVSINKITLGSKVGVIRTGAFGAESSSMNASGELVVNAGVIEPGAFINSNFSSVTIGKGVTVVGSGAFGSDDQNEVANLGAVSIDAKIVSQNALQNSEMTRLTFGSNVSAIGSGAVGGQNGPYSVGELKINGGHLAPAAFANIAASRTTIAKTVKEVGSESFDGASLGQLTIDAQIVGPRAFNQNSASSLTFGNNVQRIRHAAFESFVLPTGLNVNVPVIESDAFKRANITSVTIGSKVKSIGHSAFENTSNLVTANIQSGDIGSNAFMASSISSLVIGSGVTNIGEYSFSGNSLSSVYMANGVKSIQAFAFWGSPNLDTINLPNSIVSIGESALDSASLESVSFGTGLRYLDKCALCGNMGLSEVKFFGPPPAMEDSSIPRLIGFTLKHSNAHTVAWVAKLASNADWSQITRGSNVIQPSMTVRSVTPVTNSSKTRISALYNTTDSGQVRITVTKVGSKTPLCTTALQSRTLTGLTVGCDLSSKIRKELKKKALKLNVTLIYTPDLGDVKTTNRTLTIKKQ